MWSAVGGAGRGGAEWGVPVVAAAARLDEFLAVGPEEGRLVAESCE